jgi:hypothetical protein
MDGPRYSHGRSNVPSLSTVTCVVRVMRIVSLPSLSQLIVSDTSSLYESSCRASSSLGPPRGSSILWRGIAPSQGPASMNCPCVRLLCVTSEGKSCRMSEWGSLLVALPVELTPLDPGIAFISCALARNRFGVRRGNNGLSAGRQAVITYVPSSMIDHPHRSTDAPVLRSAHLRRVREKGGAIGGGKVTNKSDLQMQGC